MNLNYLDFEQPIADLQQKIEELRYATAGSGVNLTEEITRLEAKSQELTRQIFNNLSAWQIAQLARHDHPRFALGPGHALGLAASRVLVNAVDALRRLRNRCESIVA